MEILFVDGRVLCEPGREMMKALQERWIERLVTNG